MLRIFVLLDEKKLREVIPEIYVASVFGDLKNT